MGLFDKQKEKRELNKQDRLSRRESRAAAAEIKQTWLDKANELGAQHAGAVQAAASVDAVDLQRTAERLNRITSQGVDGRATVISARSLGEGMAGVGVSIELHLNLIDGPGAPRVLVIQQDVMGGPENYPAGLELPLKVDPGSPDDALVWTDAQPSAGQGPGQLAVDDRDARLAALASLRDQGALSDEQFRQLESRLRADS